MLQNAVSVQMEILLQVWKSAHKRDLEHSCACLEGTRNTPRLTLVLNNAGRIKLSSQLASPIFK